MSNNNFGFCWAKCHEPSLTNHHSFRHCFRKCIEGGKHKCHSSKPIHHDGCHKCKHDHHNRCSCNKH